MTDTDRARAAASARPSLTAGQRALAVATAVAILLSGLNAAVQVARVLVQCWTGRP